MAPASANPPPSEHAGNGETYGPLAIERDVKEDGRSLLVYTRRRGADPPSIASPEHDERE
jgi:hypothetical protein